MKTWLAKIFNKSTPFTQRAPRIRTNSLNNIAIRISDSESFEVETISSTGLGLKSATVSTNESEKRASGVQPVLNGTLKINNEEFPIELQVVRSEGVHLGARFVTPSPQFLKALNRHFETELAGLKLVEVNPEYLKSNPDGEPHWFQGGNRCELSYLLMGGRVNSFAIQVFGNYLEGGDGRALRASLIAPGAESLSESADKIRNKGAEILQPVREVDPSVIELATRMISAIPALPAATRAEILGYL